MKDGLEKVKFEEFKFSMIIAPGNFGKVYLAELGSSQKFFAVKSVRKELLVQTDPDDMFGKQSVFFDKDLNFLVGIDYLYESETKLFFVSPFVFGGELHAVHKRHKRFAEDQVIFYAA